jgi:hypothetical protein
MKKDFRHNEVLLDYDGLHLDREHLHELLNETEDIRLAFTNDLESKHETQLMAAKELILNCSSCLSNRIRCSNYLKAFSFDIMRIANINFTYNEPNVSETPYGKILTHVGDVGYLSAMFREYNNSMYFTLLSTEDFSHPEVTVMMNRYLSPRYINIQVQYRYLPEDKLK